MQKYEIIAWQKCNDILSYHPIFLKNILEIHNFTIAACFDLHFSVFMQLEEAFLIYIRTLMQFYDSHPPVL